MRTVIFLLVPLLWGVLWYTLRQLMLSRAYRRTAPPEERGPVIEVKERRRSPRRTGPPRCGRSGIHFLLRIAGTDAACRRCHDLEAAESRSEAAAAVAAAEQALKDPDR
jgi:hypothetical protein